MGLVIYNIFLLVYSLAIRVAAIANVKARKWISGRKGLTRHIARAMAADNGKRVWMHCASLGEYEQGRPLLEAIRQHHPDITIVLSFFSPSGYEVVKHHAVADHVFYLPMDSAAHAKKYIDAVNPSLVLWVKYEHWFYYLKELKARQVPVILVSGIFRNGQPFFRWYGGLWKKMLSCFSALFVQQEDSRQLLRSIGFEKNVFVSGDTRFDRVTAIAAQPVSLPLIEAFCAGSKVIVAGSTWEEDEEELIHYVRQHPGVKFIIAPHEVDKENLADIRKEFPAALFYTELEAGNISDGKNVLVIDNVGMLSRLYHYADIAFIGGGFGNDGVHNVLEAAVYGKPVVFGPVYEKFAEAIGLIEAGGAMSIGNALELEKIFDELLGSKAESDRMGDAAKRYVYEHAGATNKLLAYIQENRLLTS